MGPDEAKAEILSLLLLFEGREMGDLILNLKNVLKCMIVIPCAVHVLPANQSAIFHVCLC